MFLSSGYPEESRCTARLAGRDTPRWISNLAAEGRPTDKFVGQPSARESREELFINADRASRPLSYAELEPATFPIKTRIISARRFSLSLFTLLRAPTPPRPRSNPDVETGRPQSVSFIAAHPRRGVSGVVSPSGETRRFPLLSIRQN